MSRQAVERVELAPDYSIARVVGGCWQLSAGHGEERAGRRAELDALHARVELGLTTFDCADIYHGVEDLLGELIAENRHRGGPRIEVHTKLVPDLEALSRLDRAAIERGVDRSLRRLGVERLDLVQLHWWDYAVPGYVEAAQILSDLRQAGKVRLVGLTNFDTPRLREILEAGVEVATHQVQYSLLDRRPAGEMAALCQRWGVRLLAYGSLAGGFLTPGWRGRAEPAEPLANRSLVKYRLIVEEAGGWLTLQGLLYALASLAKGAGVGLAAVAQSWVLARPAVAAVLVGGRGAAHLASALEPFEIVVGRRMERRLEIAIAALRDLPGEVYELEREAGGRHALILRTDLNRIDL